MSKGRSEYQRERQEFRGNDGRYEVTDPCQGCGKPAPVNYFSHHKTDSDGWGCIALILCAKCSKATDQMEKPEEFLAYAKKKGLKKEAVREEKDARTRGIGMGRKR